MSKNVTSSTLEVGGESYEIFRLDALQDKYDVARLPYALKVLLESLIRNGEDEGAEAVAKWSAKVLLFPPAIELRF